MCQMFAFLQRLPGRLAKAMLARVCALTIVVFNPIIHISLQLLQTVINLASEGTGIELVLYCLMKPLTNTIGLWTLGFGTRLLLPALRTSLREAQPGCKPCAKRLNASASLPENKRPRGISRVV